MIQSLSDPEPEIEKSEPQSPWSVADLIIFGGFFGLTILLLPLTFLRLWRIFDPALKLSELTAVDQVLLQGVMNLILVGFIAFLIKVVHGQGFLDTIHWFPSHNLSTGFLIATGATLAITVLIVSSIFPPSESPPIEKLLSSRTAVYTFAIFGIGLAPLFEEIIFRGFLFKVLFDIGGPPAAVPLTSGLFALLHIPQLWGSWAGIAMIFVVGYVLSLVRQRSNSVIPSFIIHTAYNGMLFAVFALSTFIQKGVR